MFVVACVVGFVGWCAFLIALPLTGHCNPVDAQIRSGEFPDDTAMAYQQALANNAARDAARKPGEFPVYLGEVR